MADPFAYLRFPLLVGVFVIARVSALPVVAPPIPITVGGLAKNAVPILFQAQDYEGPFDPLDPQGVQAAQRRALAVAGKNGLDTVASYVPPGAIDMLTKDLSKVFMDEGKRFALHHPIEAADLAGIGMKLMAFLKSANNVVKSEARKEHSSNLHH